MSSILPVSSQPLLTTAPATTTPVVSVAGAVTLANSPASVVMLGQDNRITGAATYSPGGAMASKEPVFTWESKVKDAVTQVMQGNLGLASNASRFQGLGAALLQQLADGGATSISQSVFKTAAGSVLDAAAVKSEQNQLHNRAENTITLTLKTASGATITLNLSNDGDGFAIKADVSGGELSDSERSALGDMADSFQGAIDGLTAQPPRLDLGKLTKLDPNLFSSVDLSARLKVGKDQYQTLAFRADDKSRSVDMTGPSGNVQLSVNNNSAILGTAPQQAQAIQAYLAQFDAAQSRGGGDKNLMALFKDAFSSLQGGTQSLSGAQATADWSKVSDIDRGMLSGLADFSASLNQNSAYINPMRPGEIDKFAYRTAQTTEAKGSDSGNRTLQQSQTSSLAASYHKPLYPGTGLDLSTDAKTQNYTYHLIEDEARSTTRIGYADGALVQASSTQSASQSTTVLRYEMGKLVDTLHTPRQTSTSRDLMGMLDEALKRDRKAQLSGSASTLSKDMLGISAKSLLQSDPNAIRE
jgi:hypothetical protein